MLYRTIQAPNRRVGLALPLLAVGLLMIPGAVGAQGIFDHLQINGYGTWAYGKTNHNHYVFSGPDGEYDHVFAALTFAGKASEDITIFIQPNFEYGDDGFDVSLAFAFADWQVLDSMSLRTGRVRHPFGIYTEIYDVGTLRPFLSLPQGVYNAAFVARAYNGAGIHGRWFTKGDWSFEYDLYGGQIDMRSSVPGLDDMIDRTIKGTIGGRFIAMTPVEGLRFGISAFKGEQQEGGTYSIPIIEGDQTVWGLMAEYLANGWSVRAEYADQDDIGLLTNKGAYVEIAYFLTDHIQLAGRWDYFDSTNKDIQVPDFMFSLLEHDEYALALNYWVNPKFVFKLEYHDIEGNRFAGPEDIFADFAAGKMLEPSSRAIQLGVNFSF
jgi:hypothetical protein